MRIALSSARVQVEVAGTDECLFMYRSSTGGTGFAVAPPLFEIDGIPVTGGVTGFQPQAPPAKLASGVTEYRIAGQLTRLPGVTLELVLRIPEDNPVVRFRYRLSAADGLYRMSKNEGEDRLAYCAIRIPERHRVKEVRLSDFVQTVHSYCLVERELEEQTFTSRAAVPGPILAAIGADESFLLAYEHGSELPDTFLHYRLEPDRTARLHAVKGNYLTGQPIGDGHSYESVWLQAAGVRGGEQALAAAYRDFVLRSMSVHKASRQPYIFYNTWNNQERDKHWRGRSYLDAIRQDRMLAEIEKAHRMGIEVFVIDTGWYIATGDWEVNPDKFPDRLKAVKDKLDEYGMKLGLWFGPNSAALSSAMLERNRSNVMQWKGSKREPHPVWETELSEAMCLVSSYSDDFAETLIRLSRELGVTYFKWDAVQQYGCDHDGHWHGDAAHSREERRDCYAFRLGLQLTRIVERLQEACPEAIVDFDITEGGRYVGLGFLSVGKYFLINNGPYYQNYDVKIDEARDNWNLFFQPGLARSWIARSTYAFDKWVPSVLFLTHYYPDDPARYQLVSCASLILGHNGIWGDLLSVSEEGAGRIAEVLAQYKEVREDITESTMAFTGKVGSGLEAYEKISSRTGRGAVVVFSTVPGRQTYVTRSRVSGNGVWRTEGTEARVDPQGYARIDIDFEAPSAAIVFFK